MINKSLNYILTMITYCFKCSKNAESKNPIVVKTKNRKIMLLSESAVCDSKKLKFINPIQDGSFRGCSRMREGGGLFAAAHE